MGKISTILGRGGAGGACQDTECACEEKRGKVVDNSIRHPCDTEEGNMCAHISLEEHCTPGYKRNDHDIESGPDINSVLRCFSVPPCGQSGKEQCAQQ